MPNILTNLWNGDISLCDSCGIYDPEVKELIRLLERNRSTLYNEITNEQQKILKNYIDCAEEYLIRMTEHAFCDGFRFAAKLLLEALAEGN